ncbi:hypothetical protein [Cesiribacter sp. SM1]|uniref:hypothetical protein n=1 Tax=Cesiribacter sp. SM1 TaxID=2861196 RepID=UPI001CD205FA|nr:hypothetical protein [Cesiribacter sp. SM1]
MSIQKILEQKQKYVPKTGYNVVGVDRYEIPGSDDALFLIAHTHSLQEAEHIRAQYNGNEGITAYIYTPDAV